VSRRTASSGGGNGAVPPSSTGALAYQEHERRPTVEAKLVRMTPGELEGYLVHLAAVTPVVRWNGVPVAVAEAARRARELEDTVPVATHGVEVYALN
jgi:hypothetical protein